MILRREFLEKIKLFGLNSYEARIWIALLSRGVSTAGELSDIANVPRSRAYDILESLEKKGFIVQKIGKPIKYIAIPPEEVVERVKKRLLKEAEEKTSIIESLKQNDLFEELKALHSQGIELVHPEELSMIVKGRSNIYDRLAELFKQAQKEILISTTSKALKNKVRAIYKHLQKASKRGVKVEISIPKHQEQEVSEELELLKKICKVSLTNHESRFIIVDNKHNVLMLTPEQVPDFNDSALIVQSEFLANSLKTLHKQAKA